MKWNDDAGVINDRRGWGWGERQRCKASMAGFSSVAVSQQSMLNVSSS